METSTHAASRPGLAGTVELAKRAFEAYKRKAGSLIAVILLTYLATALLTGLVSLVVGFAFAGAIATGGMKVATGMVVLAVAFAVLVNIFMTTISSVMMVDASVSEKPRPIGAMFGDALKGWKSALWILVLGGFYALGAYGLLVIPGIAVAIFTAFSLYVFVDGRAKGNDAILQSHAIVSGRWWAVFGRGLLVGIVMMAAYFALSMILASIDNVWVQLIGTYAVMIAVLMPFLLLFSAELYREVRKHPVHLSAEKKESLKRNYLWAAIVGTVLVLVFTGYSVSMFVRTATSGISGYEDSADIRINPLLGDEMLDLSL